MYCNKCGTEFDDGAAYCPNCGAATNGSVPKQTNGCAIAGFILAFFMPLIGFILSIVGIAKAKDCGGSGKGLAIAGLVLSLLVIIVYIILVALVFVPLIAGGIAAAGGGAFLLAL